MDQQQSGPAVEVEEVPSTGSFTRRALIAATVALVAVLVLLLIWYAGQVLLLTFAAILAAVFFRTLSSWLEQHSPLSSGASVLVTGLALLILAGLGGWLFASSIGDQVGQLTEELPRAIEQLRRRLERTSWGRQLLQLMQRANTAGSAGSVASGVGSFFSTTFGSIANLVIILIVGLYLAANPRLYIDGFVRLFPHRKRDRAREVLHNVGYTLRWWLVGTLIVMVINGIISGVGLMLLGIPMALVLGLLTALLNFIPNIGPILAGIPAVLLAFTQGPDKALFVVLLYLAVQNLEGFVLTPLVQERAVSLPPAMVMMSQVLFGVLAGTLGVLLATPIAATALVLVKMLYVEDVLGDPVDVAEDE